MAIDRAVLCSVVIMILCRKTKSECYFPSELQGEFVMQSAVHSGNPIQYSHINVTVNSIAIWGNCHKRIGNNIVFLSSSEESNCYRCFRVKLRAKNVLQVHAKRKDISKCYLTEEAAVINCPTEKSSKSELTELILFKTKDSQNKPVQYEYCPISGNYYVTYNINDGSGNKKECVGRTSELTTCLNGTSLQFKFRQCSFENYDMELKCLGSWDGHDGEKYLVLFNPSQSHYQCAIFKRDLKSGVIYLSMSKDSTFNTELFNATHGHDELVLTAKPEKDWPDSTVYTSCKFPDWMHGNWEHLTVDETMLIYNDNLLFKTYTIKCVAQVDASEGFKFIAYGKTPCGEEMYTCMWIKQRGNNILEFVMGSKSGSDLNANLCDYTTSENVQWITQGKLDKGYESPCPISGEYNGSLPDGTGYCAKLWSDCRAPELMYYQITNCDQEIYEEREYRCLGQWSEHDLLYTYTQRRDVADGTYECFVGAIKTDMDIYIKEAGNHCQRDINPHRDGMNLSKQGHIPTSCLEPANSTTPAMPTTRFSTKSWTPTTEQVTPDNESNDIGSGTRQRHALCILELFTYLFIVLLLKRF